MRIQYLTNAKYLISSWSVTSGSTYGLNLEGRILDTGYCTQLVPVVKGKKVRLSLRFSWAPRHEGVLGEWRYSSTHSLTSALYGGKWSALRPGRFTPRERAPGTHWIEGWVGPTVVLDAVVKRKFPASAGNRNLESRSSSPQPSVIPTELSRLLVPVVRLCNYYSPIYHHLYK
jgi:hypothetical protein